jgi:hypothetical protein
MGDLPADKYVLNVVEKVRANDLEEALMVLPFNQVLSLINYLDQWAKKVSYFSEIKKQSKNHVSVITLPFHSSGLEYHISLPYLVYPS